MKLKITKSARQFGYLIWTSKEADELYDLIQHKDVVKVRFNGFPLGDKNVDRRYHRISLGFRQTRAMPESNQYFVICYKKGVLEVSSVDE